MGGSGGRAALEENCVHFKTLNAPIWEKNEEAKSMKNFMLYRSSYNP